jgi:hypothetical protein
VSVQAVTQAMTLCSCMYKFHCFLEVYYLHVHCQTWSSGIYTYQTTLCHIAEDCSLKVSVIVTNVNKLCLVSKF